MSSATFSYDKWVSEQAASIAAAMRANPSANSNAAVFVIPSCGAKPGRLVLANSAPDGACDVVRFHGIGSSVGWVPFSSLPTLLWQACRRMPICPTE